MSSPHESENAYPDAIAKSGSEATVSTVERLEGLFNLLCQTSPTDSVAAQFLAQHRHFGRYELVKPLGEGAMGFVFLARDTKLGREVALKIPKTDSSDPDRLARFDREARTAARVRHPNICPVFDIGEIDGHHFITMAFIDGQPLSQRIPIRESLQGTASGAADRDAARLICKVAEALEEAHRMGVLHGDLKPSNIMVDSRGEPIVTDFGLARQLDRGLESHVSASGCLIGTPAYMSPEQVRGEELTASTDVYSLGVVLYELLTGSVPFSGTVGVVIGKILNEPPLPPSMRNPGTSRQLEAICLKMMANRREDRYRSMSDVSHALQHFLDDERREAHLGGRVAEESTVESPLRETGLVGQESGAIGDTKRLRSDQPTERFATARHRLYFVFRWIACAPAALIAGFVLHLIVLFGNRWSLELSYMNPDSFLGKLWCQAFGSLVLGAATILVAVKVAPSRKTAVAVVAAAAILFYSGLCSYPVVLERAWWDAYMLVWTNIGAIGMAYSLIKTESGP
jgi:predicted Ser/Thr protein kinase